MGHAAPENLCAACLRGLVRGSDQERFLVRRGSVEELVKSERLTGSTRQKLSRFVEGTGPLTSREQILSNTRDALDRRPGDPIPPPPPVLLREAPTGGLVAQFRKALEALAGKVVVVKTAEEAKSAIVEALNGRTFIQASEPFSREAMAQIEVGITSADYALADTGSLVIFTESHESRLLSLLPPCHIAVIDSSRIVPSLDDVLRLRPTPGDGSSAMIVITGPSRTADIEMRLVRGVHGPGEIHVIIIDSDMTDVTHSD
jgi:L-lactate dehydrogenase complex protein LldG